MTATVSPVLGRPVWYKLMTTTGGEVLQERDWLRTSAPFAVVGQVHTPYSSERDVGVGGLMKTPDNKPLPPFWAMYIAVPELEHAVAHIKARRKRASPVIEVPTVGRLQMMKDPQGAAFTSSSRHPV